MGSLLNEQPKHALLGASSAYRWLQCTPSAIAESRYADDSSVYAEEGTLAHAYAAVALSQTSGQDAREAAEDIERLREKYDTEEMHGYVEAYADYVLERLAEARLRDRYARLVVEQKVTFGRWVPDGFGTADALIITDTEIEVIDLKYGKGVRVEAEGNPQLRLYAAGAVDLYQDVYPLRHVTYTIVQPRLGHISTETTQASDLLDWCDNYVKPLAGVAAHGLGQRHAGPWCGFCKARGGCAALAMEAIRPLEIAAGDTLTDDETANLLPQADIAELWVKALRDHATARALSGHTLPGYKLVKSMQRRMIADARLLGERLESNGISRDRIYRTDELRTITDLERAAGGKKRFTTIAGECITLSAAKPVLVPEKDRRPALDPAHEFADIKFN